MASGDRKRQYQPSVLSYFSTLSERKYGSNSTPALPVPVQHQTIAPSVPSVVQSSLLNVGMRVRKAVPEGYKNKPSIVETSAKLSINVESSAFDQENNCAMQPFGASHNSSGTHYRSGELLPFCGVHKVGGWATQEESPRQHTVPTLGFFSSQESNASSFSAASTSPGQAQLAMHPKKRQLEDYEDHYRDELEEETGLVDKDYPVFTIFADGAVGEEFGQGMTLDRRIARPVTRKKAASPPQTHDPTGTDFEDAAFLQEPTGAEEMEDW